MACRVCGKSFMQSCTDVTKLTYKYDHFTRQKKMKIYTYPLSNGANHIHHRHKGHSKLGRNARSFHDLRQFYGAKSEEKMVMVTKCGHLFHKGCLRDYIAFSRREEKKAVVGCPVCKEKVMLSSCNGVDIKIHNGLTSRTDKHFERAQWMQKELLSQLQRCQLSVEEAETTREGWVRRSRKANKWESGYREHQKARKDAIKRDHDNMIDSLDHQLKLADALRDEYRGYAGVYLQLVCQDSFPKDEIDERIPKEFIPHLHFILNHDALLDKFTQIIFRPTLIGMAIDERRVQELMEEVLYQRQYVELMLSKFYK